MLYIYIKLAVAEAALRWGVAFSLFLLHYKTWQATAFTRDSVERLQPDGRFSGFSAPLLVLGLLAFGWTID